MNTHPYRRSAYAPARVRGLTVEYRPASPADHLPWEVVDASGKALSGHATEDEAIDEARAVHARIEAEADEESWRIFGTREALIRAAETSLDPEALEKALAILTASRRAR